MVKGIKSDLVRRFVEVDEIFYIVQPNEIFLTTNFDVSILICVNKYDFYQLSMCALQSFRLNHQEKCYRLTLIDYTISGKKNNYMPLVGRQERIWEFSKVF